MVKNIFVCMHIRERENERERMNECGPDMEKEIQQI